MILLYLEGSGSKFQSVNTKTSQFSPFFGVQELRKNMSTPKIVNLPHFLDSRSWEKTCIYIYMYIYISICIYIYMYICQLFPTISHILWVAQLPMGFHLAPRTPVDARNAMLSHQTFVLCSISAPDFCKTRDICIYIYMGKIWGQMERIMLFEKNVRKMNKSNIVRVFFTMDIFFLIMSNSSKKQNNSKKYPHLFQTNKYPKDPNIIWLPKHYPQDSPQLPTNLTPKDGSRSRTCKARWSHRRKMCLGVISIVEQTLVVNCKPKTSPLSGNSCFFFVGLPDYSEYAVSPRVAVFEEPSVVRWTRERPWALLFKMWHHNDWIR